MGDDTPPRRQSASAPYVKLSGAKDGGDTDYGMEMGRARTFIRAYSVRCATELRELFYAEFWDFVGD